MRHAILSGLVGLGLLAGAAAAQAQERVTLQLKWVTQAQFAGYYVAQARGMYRAANLDVRIDGRRPRRCGGGVDAGGAREP